MLIADEQTNVKSAVIIDGTSGIGDCLHQRALIRPLLRKYRSVWLRTPWPQFYYDFPRLHLSPLYSRDAGRWGPWQIANERASAALFTPEPREVSRKTLHCRYIPAAECGCSIVEAMAKSCGVKPESFQFPIPDTWTDSLDEVLYRAYRDDRPLMVLRQITDRKNFLKGTLRNPDAEAFMALFKEVRDQFFVVSIADLVDDQEWLAGEELDADVRFHHGELSVEQIIGLIGTAAIVFSPVCFAAVAAQAVGTPSIVVFGGHESAASYAYGRDYAPMLAIEPVEPCHCFNEKHDCKKAIDLPKAIKELRAFLAGQPT